MGELQTAGYFERHARTSLFGSIVLLAAFVLIIPTIFFSILVGPLAALVPMILFVTGIALLAMKIRRTTAGYDALRQLEGFKLFMSVTDKERFTFHNAPARNAETYMQYLPYAVAFGVEREWAAVFDDLTMVQPSWYEAAEDGAFSAAQLSSGLQELKPSSLQTIAEGSNKSSSSWSSSSSSGGGSVGSGSGGGGGGSW